MSYQQERQQIVRMLLPQSAQDMMAKICQRSGVEGILLAIDAPSTEQRDVSNRQSTIKCFSNPSDSLTVYV